MTKYIDNIDDCSALLFFLISTNAKAPESLCVQGKPDKRKAAQAWMILYNDYLSNFGLPEAYTDYLKLRIKANKAWLDVYLKGQRFKKLKAQLYEAQAFSLISEDDDNQIEHIGVIAAKLSRHYKFNIDPSQVSVRQFNSYIVGMKNG